MKRRRNLSLLWLCYGAAMLAWLLLCAGHLALDAVRQSRGQMRRQALAPADFADTTTGIAFSDDWASSRYFVTTDADAQLHLTFDEGAPVGRVVFAARAVNKPGGEMALYYATSPGQAFSETRKLPAMQNANGDWVFDLNSRRVYALRLDPDSVGGVYWQVYAIVLNENVPPLAYFTPDGLEILVLAFAPALLYAALVQMTVFFQPTLSRRRLERRWQRPDATPLPPPKSRAREKEPPPAPRPVLPKPAKTGATAEPTEGTTAAPPEEKKAALPEAADPPLAESAPGAASEPPSPTDR